ncbi:fatty acid--CoA ligase FadD11 [Mycobacteriaceae bacterium NPDC060252]
MTDVAPPPTVCEAFQRTAAIDPDAIALRTPRDTQTITWRQYANQVHQAAAGLAGLGVGRGDTVSLMMANRIEFYPLEVGAQHLGATSFSIYNTLSAEQLTHILTNAGTKVVVCEGQYIDRIRASGIDIDHIVCIDGPHEGALTLADLIAAAPSNFDFESSWRAVQPDDVATLVYTSGTTGDPKGVELTHSILLYQVHALGDVLGIRFGDRTTSFLPSAHIADRVFCLYSQEVFGTQLTAVSDARTIATVLPDVRPTYWGAVPRVWEKLKAALEFNARNESDEARRSALQWALGVAAEKTQALIDTGRVPSDIANQWRTADEQVLAKLREQLGLGCIRWAVSGGAAVPQETLAFFMGLGIPIAEVWGMSELGAVATASHPDQVRLGTVGTLLPGLECRVEDDGELLVRGPLVMKGYRKEPHKTAEAIDKAGWLRTGDIASIDCDGYVRIVDRKKELIINAYGKNMSPTNIENTLKAACPLIGSVLVFGEARPYNTALIVLDADSASTNVPHPTLADAIAAGVAAANAKLSRVEQIKRFRVLPGFWEPGGDELTLTMKLKRRSIAQKYAIEINELYASALESPNERSSRTDVIA